MHSVASVNACSVIKKFHSKCYVLYADECFCAKSDMESRIDVLLNLRQVETNGVTPVPTFQGQRLVAVQQCAFVASSQEQAHRKA